MKQPLIPTKTLQGFRDFLPELMMPREWLMDVARKVYRSYGYAPIDTPALEDFAVLGGKGGAESDRQMYQFVHNDKHHVGMRFDLTVPLARYVAQHVEQLGLPFKRYHIAPVWRGERPQAGRYREFVQCDFDTIGSTSMASDVETGLVIHDLLKAIGFEKFTIRVNHRKILNGLLEKFGLSDQATSVLRAIDKLEKAGPAKVSAELAQCGITDRQIEQILQLATISGDKDQVLKQLQPMVADNEQAQSGWDELNAFSDLIRRSGAEASLFKIDPSIARGLDYYTGVVFETVLNDAPNMGSVCSGGRYDNLAELFTNQHLPGVGASLGLDRLLACMEKLDMLPHVSTPADVLIVHFDAERLGDYLHMANTLRQRGLSVEVYPSAKKLGQQFKYADRRGFQAAIVAGSQEFEKQQVQVKWLGSGKQLEISVSDGCDALSQHLIENLAVKP